MTDVNSVVNIDHLTKVHTKKITWDYSLKRSGLTQKMTADYLMALCEDHQI